jgi:hypothetical protein
VHADPTCEVLSLSIMLPCARPAYYGIIAWAGVCGRRMYIYIDAGCSFRTSAYFGAIGNLDETYVETGVTCVNFYICDDVLHVQADRPILWRGERSASGRLASLLSSDRWIVEMREETGGWAFERRCMRICLDPCVRGGFVRIWRDPMWANWGVVLNYFTAGVLPLGCCVPRSETDTRRNGIYAFRDAIRRRACLRLDPLWLPLPRTDLLIFATVKYQ